MFVVRDAGKKGNGKKETEKTVTEKTVYKQTGVQTNKISQVTNK